MKLFAIIDEQNERVLAILAQEMLLRLAREKGAEAEIHLQGQGMPLNIPTSQNAGDVLLFVNTDKKIPEADDLAVKFHGAVMAASRDDVFDTIDDLWKQIEDASVKHGGEPLSSSQETSAPTQTGKPSAVKKIVAVTSCPTGIAHTFMAAEALNEGAKALNIPIRVETQGSVGAGDPLTEEEIKDADLVIIAADREVDKSRFDGKYIYVSGTKPAIHNGKAYIEMAMKSGHIQNAAATKDNATEDTTESSEQNGGSKAKELIYKPLMNGISFMLPFVVAGGLLMALALAIGGVNVADKTGTLGNYLWQIGKGNTFPLIIPVLAGYIAYAISDRPALAPGMVGGLIASQIDAGFIGGIIAGFLAGYITKLCIRYIILPKSMEGLKPVLIIPLIATAATGLIMLYIGGGAAWIMHTLSDWVENMQAGQSGEDIASTIVLGATLGGMMAIDMGGPINKAAYAVALALLEAGTQTTMAPVMIGGMVPPMALAVAAYIRPSAFTSKERDSRLPTFIMGLSFISEGAIPYAARRPLRIIPAMVVGSAVAGAIAMYLGVAMVAPHGGIFLLIVKGAIIKVPGYFIAIISGIVVSVLALCLLCRSEKTAEPVSAQKQA